MDLYSENILFHFKESPFRGKIDDASVEIEEHNPLCGDKLKVYLKFEEVDEDKILKEIKFEGEGCAISQAATSMLAEAIKGKSVEEIKNLDNQFVYDLLGVPISPARVKCALLGLVAVKRGI